VAECAVIGVKDALKTQLPVGLVVLKSGVDRLELDLAREMVDRVRSQVGPVANFKQVVIVGRLPKTRSGKVLRKTMRLIADGEAWTMPPTIDDPSSLDEITMALKRLGLAHGPGSPIGG
jgi:propionyl-CoA synthetase